MWQGDTYPCSACTSACGILVTATGTVSGGPSSSNYIGDNYCRWLIAPKYAYTVTITFNLFDIDLFIDTVTLSSCTDLSCTSKQQLLKHSGSSLPSPQSFTSYTGFLMVEFKSDYTLQKPGFTATWTSEIAVSSPSFKLITSTHFKLSKIYIQQSDWISVYFAHQITIHFNGYVSSLPV